VSTTFSPKSLALGVSGLQLPDDQPVGEHSCKKNNRRVTRIDELFAIDAEACPQALSLEVPPVFLWKAVRLIGTSFPRGACPDESPGENKTNHELAASPIRCRNHPRAFSRETHPHTPSQIRSTCKASDKLQSLAEERIHGIPEKHS